MTDAGNETRVLIDSHESLPDVLTRLRALPGGPVVLEIPDHCPLLLTATEFRALKDVAEQQHLQLTLDTEDRLRRQLASMFGLVPATEAPVAAATNGKAPPARSPGGRSLGGWRAARQAVEADAAAAGEPAKEEAADPIAVSRRRRTQLYEPEFAGQKRAEPDGKGGLNGSALDYLDEEQATRRLNARLVGRLVAAGIAVLAILLFALWFYLPGVTVRLTLQQEPLNTSLIYSIAAPGAVVSNDSVFTVNATKAQADVNFTVTAKTTGVKKQPDKTAAGAVELRNPGNKSVKVPQGTKLTTLAGPGYATLKDVEVPAASGKKPGEATVQVTASTPGTAGNLPQGYLTGKLDNLGVYYSNRSAAIGGGTDTSIPVVSDQDIQAIENKAQNDLNTITAGAWQGQLPQGTTVLASSVQASNPSMIVNQKAGDQTDTVILTGTVHATGLTYSQADVEQQARIAVAKRMGGQVPKGFELDQSSILLSAPQMVAEAPDNAQFALSATGTARTTFSQEQRDSLRDSLAGKSPSDAMAIIRSQAAIKSADISYSPGWWPHRMPQTGSRIKVAVTASTTTAPSQPAGTPVATPPGKKP